MASRAQAALSRVSGVQLSKAPQAAATPAPRTSKVSKSSAAVPTSAASSKASAAVATSEATTSNFTSDELAALQAIKDKCGGKTAKVLTAIGTVRDGNGEHLVDKLQKYTHVSTMKKKLVRQMDAEAMMLRILNKLGFAMLAAKIVLGLAIGVFSVIGLALLIGLTWVTGWPFLAALGIVAAVALLLLAIVFIILLIIKGANTWSELLNDYLECTSKCLYCCIPDSIKETMAAKLLEKCLPSFPIFGQIFVLGLTFVFTWIAYRARRLDVSYDVRIALMAFPVVGLIAALSITQMLVLGYVRGVDKKKFNEKVGDDQANDADGATQEGVSGLVDASGLSAVC